MPSTGDCNEGFLYDNVIVEASSKKEAVEMYNKYFKCDYFYGKVMCKLGPNNEILDIDDGASVLQCKQVIRSNRVLKYLLGKLVISHPENNHEYIQ